MPTLSIRGEERGLLTPWLRISYIWALDLLLPLGSQTPSLLLGSAKPCPSFKASEASPVWPLTFLPIPLLAGAHSSPLWALLCVAHCSVPWMFVSRLHSPGGQGSRSLQYYLPWSTHTRQAKGGQGAWGFTHPVLISFLCCCPEPLPHLFLNLNTFTFSTTFLSAIEGLDTGACIPLQQRVINHGVVTRQGKGGGSLGF